MPDSLDEDTVEMNGVDVTHVPILSNPGTVSISVLSRRTTTFLTAAPSPSVYAGAQAGLNGPVKFTATVVPDDPNVLNPPACYDTATTTKPCWNGGYPTGTFAIWEVTELGAHVGATPLVEFTLVASDLGVKTFTTPANWEILSPGRHYFRAEYEGTSATIAGSGPTEQANRERHRVLRQQSARLTHDVYLSGLIGLNSVDDGLGQYSRRQLRFLISGRVPGKQRTTGRGC